MKACALLLVLLSLCAPTHSWGQAKFEDLNAYLNIVIHPNCVEIHRSDLAPYQWTLRSSGSPIDERHETKKDQIRGISLSKSVTAHLLLVGIPKDSVTQKPLGKIISGTLDTFSLTNLKEIKDAADEKNEVRYGNLILARSLTEGGEIKSGDNKKNGDPLYLRKFTSASFYVGTPKIEKDEKGETFIRCEELIIKDPHEVHPAKDNCYWIDGAKTITVEGQTLPLCF